MTMQEPPPPDPTAAAGAFWTQIDRRFDQLIRSWSDRRLGTPRSRTMTLTFSLSDATAPPPTGWLVSAFVFQSCRVSAWAIHAGVRGNLQLDVRASRVEDNPSIPPTYTSLPGAGQFPTLTNGYTTMSIDTTAWASRDLVAGTVLHVYALSSASLSQVTFALQLTDLFGRVLQ